ncbi:adenylate/guanylate cyclase domain-containing protein [Taklimakanibacter lacteus]|uniref:adenylate/guanylate cyclase domain-containing protein n=1 Tax=Taklimakanibacter lacteus TaxID=2268456 RepID=UPI0013C40DF7
MALSDKFVDWLVATAVGDKTLPDLHRELCEKLVDLGIPLWRSSLGLELLNPEIEGSQFRWVAYEVKTLVMPRGYDTGEYTNSPAKIVDDTRKSYRRKLDKPADDMPLLEELRQSGATDYFITPFPFIDQQRTAHISFATQKQGGFSEDEIADLTRASLLFSPYAERRVLKKITFDLLTTYVGRRSAAKVYDGAIDRGKAEIITATILIADLRGFTRYSDTHQIDNVLSTLNDFFDALVEAIEPHGGEVLKFIGDAVLAIFPAGDKQQLPCGPAIAAALDTRRKIAKLNEERAKAGRTLLRFGLALNVGEIAYGNIGSRTRLDFTAIGPAINHTSRLLEVAKRRNRDIVVSESFVRAAGSEFPNLGYHSLRDVAGEQQVFYIAEEA